MNVSIRKTRPGIQGAAALLLLLFAIASLTNCSDTVTGPGEGSGNGNPSDSSGIVTFFPNSRNDFWQYEVFDSLGDSIVDTLKITIRGEFPLLTGALARVWETYHQRINSTDSTYVRVAGDSVQFYGSDIQAFGHDLFLLPLSENLRWENPGLFGSDSGGVQAIDSITVPAGTYPVAARVLNGWNTDFTTDGNVVTSWVADSVGIIQQQRIGKVVFLNDTTIFENTVWRLIRTNLPPG